MTQHRLISSAAVLDKIRESHRNMTPTYQRIAQYVNDHHEDLAFASSAQVAAAVGSSAATVVRFAMALGLSGYAELQALVRREIRNGTDTVAELEHAIKNDDHSSILQNLLRADITNLEVMAASGQDQTFNKMVTALAEAPTIHLLGLRSSNGLMRHLALYLGWIGRSASVIEPGIGDLPEQFMLLQPHDVCLGLSCRRYVRSSVKIFARIRELGVRTIALTDSELSPLIEHAVHALIVPVRYPAFFESKTAILSVMNALLFGLALVDRERTIASLKEHEVKWVAHNTYFNESFMKLKADIEVFARHPRPTSTKPRPRSAVPKRAVRSHSSGSQR
jgi:DNA-binding MurR/RpiR family transcriptional regulator